MNWFFNKNDDNLQEENRLLKLKNQDLENQIKILEKKIINMNLESNTIMFDDNSEIDEADDKEIKLKNSVKALVDDILKNDSINNELIPDYVERKIYENIFNPLIKLMKEILESSSINFLNQNIKL